MDTRPLFEMALGLQGSPWKITTCEFDPQEGLKLKLEFDQGHRFACPHCGQRCPTHDTRKRRWRHMNFFQFACHLEAAVPRTQCPEHGVSQVPVPWAREGSGFTLLFEAMVLLMASSMPMRAVSRHLGVTDTRLWRVLEHYTQEAHRQQDWSHLEQIMVDETSSKRGHRYVTAVADARKRRLLFLEPGHDKEALGAFARAMPRHGARPEQIQLVCMDMSRAYRAASREYFPQAHIVFDRFHLMQLAGQALEEVRKELAAQGAEMGGALWALRGNEATRTPRQVQLRHYLCEHYPVLGRAMSLRETLQDILDGCHEDMLRAWTQWADRSRLPAFRRLSATIKEHWDGIVAFMHHRLTNAAIEAINGVIQLAKRMARGFRSFHKLRAIVYLRAAHLQFNLPSPLPT